MSTLPLKIERLEAGHVAIISDFNEKHQANEKKWETFNRKLDDLMEKITSIRIENARWNIGAGTAVAVIIEGIRHVWPK